LAKTLLLLEINRGDVTDDPLRREVTCDFCGRARVLFKESDERNRSRNGGKSRCKSCAIKIAIDPATGKPCQLCKRRLPPEAFHSNGNGGLRGECRDCAAIRQKYRSQTAAQKAACSERQRKRRLAEPEVVREQQRRSLKKHLASRSKYQALRRALAPQKSKAHQLVWWAVKLGALTRQPCEECGRVEVEAHHDDYARPLDVRWLCRWHHGAWHRQHGEGANAGKFAQPLRLDVCQQAEAEAFK
jgi:hypothetical protein